MSRQERREEKRQREADKAAASEREAQELFDMNLKMLRAEAARKQQQEKNGNG